MGSYIEATKFISFIIPDIDDLFSTIRFLEIFYANQGIDYKYNIFIEDEINVIFEIWKKQN
jgi:hypothetical protein